MRHKLIYGAGYPAKNNKGLQKFTTLSLLII
jgi:hypothetical protein